VDARPGDGGMMDGPAEFTCRNQVTTGLDNGHHREGMDCQSSCHNHNFFLSGTLFTDGMGTGPVAGASITFIDANGFVGDMVSGTNGNFWWAALPVAFPVRLIASMCPDVKPMNATIDAAGAGCNKAGCHGASPSRVHLP
jgi:hypothetical protein